LVFDEAQTIPDIGLVFYSEATGEELPLWMKKTTSFYS